MKTQVYNAVQRQKRKQTDSAPPESPNPLGGRRLRQHAESRIIAENDARKGSYEVEGKGFSASMEGAMIPRAHKKTKISPRHPATPRSAAERRLLLLLRINDSAYFESRDWPCSVRSQRIKHRRANHGACKTMPFAVL